jgi:predicted transcriptional regulator
MMISSIDEEDMVFHTVFIGATGAGKTNALLYWLHRLFTNRRDAALALIDPHGDAAIELMRVIPRSEWHRVTLLDPTYVSFGLNPLSLPKGVDAQNKAQVLQTQVEELSVLLSDVLNTDAANAPRLMWIFKGALYYLYTLDDNPTFKDLYRILMDFISLPKDEVASMLRAKGLRDEIISSTIDAISKLQKDAFSPVINRISNFVLPPQSITSRTFCSRTSRLDFDEMTIPGNLTIFRITKTLPHDFRNLISASIVMRFYFAVQKRAFRLEKAGRPPSERTPIVLAVDEFQNISDMNLLDSVLSESRKYGLFLWMVNQNLQQIRKDLSSSIFGNVGPVFSFRVGPDDASKVAELLSPRWKEEVRDALISLPDYSCVARKRPHGEDVATKPLLLEPFPKLSDPICDANSVLDYMKGEMEQKYGGAQEAMDLVYRNIFEQIAGDKGSDSSRVPFMPMHWRILTTGYLKLLSDAYSLEFSRLKSELYAKYSWSTSAVQQALNELVNAGYLTQTFVHQTYVMKGKDAYGNPIMVPPNPSVADDMERAKTIIYSLTPRALESFEMKFGPSRTGDPKHIRVIEKLLKEEYWSNGYYCVVDWGESGEERPDIAVLKPSVTTVQVKGAAEAKVPSGYAWDYSSATAVEVEMSPQKNREQVKKNFNKNKGVYALVRFVVTSENQAKQLYEILNEDPPADPAKYRIDTIEYESLNVIEPKPIENSEEQPVQTGEPLGKLEERIMACIVKNGFTSREALVQDCREAGIQVSARSVSRCLKALTEKGLLQREGKSYVPTEIGKKRFEMSGNPEEPRISSQNA